MTPTLTALVADAQATDRRRAADRRRAHRETSRRIRPRGAGARPTEPTRTQDAIVLRLAGAEDGQTVRRLAELDEAAEPNGEVLLALIAGEAVAALSLDDGHVVSNPFVATSDAIALLGLRARHLAGTGRRRRRLRLRPRFA